MPINLSFCQITSSNVNIATLDTNSKKNSPKAEFIVGGNKATFDFGDVGEKISEKIDNAKEKLNSNSASRQKIIFGVLSIFLGGFGAHDLLRGNIVGFVFSLLFCWTCIPAIFGLI